MLQKKVSIKGFVPDKYPFGINLIGDIRAETGLGQSMRILADILEEGKFLLQSGKWIHQENWN